MLIAQGVYDEAQHHIQENTKRHYKVLNMNLKQVKYELQHLISGESGTSYDALIQTVARYLRSGKRASPVAEEKHQNKGEEAARLLRFARENGLLIKKNEYRPSFTKIEDNLVKDPIAEYILTKPKENQITDISHKMMQIIGNMYPIPDQEIKVYIARILNSMNTEQLRDILVRKWSYTDKIKSKIKQLADSYAERRFMDLIKSKKIRTKENWRLSKEIVPGNTGSSIGNSLYEKEGSMNNFEERVAMELGTSSNIEFWHRNLERGKGFYINGFKANHYPDFIMQTKSGKTILVETKGDHLDGSDSEAKCRLGNEWEKQAGNDFAYFMIFDKKEVDGAYTLDKAKELIGGM